MKLTTFRRFESLEILGLPVAARLIALVGPNGTGKSSLFDSFLVRYRMDAFVSANHDNRYHDRSARSGIDLANRIVIRTHGDMPLRLGSVYVRTAYRHDPEFAMNAVSRQGPILNDSVLHRLIQTDVTVSSNYERLAAQLLEDHSGSSGAKSTTGSYEDLIKECRESLKRLFPDLTLVGVGNPLNQGTFLFDKGSSKGLDYKNLSGGEKAAFDLLLDLVIKRRVYTDAVYCIDEPEIHMNTKLHGPLLGEILKLIPEQSQLWIGSHSIGMMRKARELYEADPNSVAFLDFGGHDFDGHVVIAPTKPTRALWESILQVALDDLASLVAPREVVICEGHPAGRASGKNAEHDAQIYQTIFADEYPDVLFVSAGSAKEVVGDVFGVVAVLRRLATGMKVSRLIDLDDHALADVVAFQNQGINVLSRRHIEAYLYDNEVLIALCESVGKAERASSVIAAKEKAIVDSIEQRGNPIDDVKSASGTIYNEAKRILGLVQVGNDQLAFARSTLAPLIKPGMAVYKQLETDIFGS